ncbi:hypothetical protein [Syntrophotalea acetylenica]|uniref:Uncharacterized protein n=1 Tax=Syntrophotalea acetylenica TaxID=29542 RepID=A0A1L3GDF9_SYNAC|nr:hypothetical protein [Syntrophotalea acetylenica]APG23976.1 hypothetical protein A7E75_02275 [Syntrophotalea acetylenica]APG44558.1 hypothetical protein A6070_10895 [Syntrophotalea acetylenica]
MPSKVAFLDYQVIDHLHRMANGIYKGQHVDALRLFEFEALMGHYELWMAEITQVEMIIGRENPRIDPDRIPEFAQRDQAKLAIAERLGVRWLGYPCSKTDDQYSRLDVSFRIAGPDWAIAEAFEQRIEQMPGVSVGDARQVASLIYGFDDADVSFRPEIQWLVTEDEPLRAALRREINAGQLTELSQIQVVSVAELVAAS